MATYSFLLNVCRSGCDLISSICVVVFVPGLTTPTPRIELPLMSEPSVYTKSWSFHFWLWSLVWSMCVVVRGFYGAGVSIYDFMMSMLCASICVVSMNVV